MPCESSNCGGYTLEAELGIAPNGHSEPDYLGWEIKQFGVKSFNRIQSAVITLMTPEPTGGLYASDGAQKFIIKYGYKDVSGRQDRMNFGGIHKVGIRNTRTNLEIKLVGFDPVEKRIRNTGGKIVLLDKEEIEVASWSFASLLIHWNRKHNMACYVPSVSDRNGGRKYMYGNKVKFGIGTDFQYFLTQMSLGNIYYDPGIKMEHVSTTPKIKKRSQFRIKSSFLNNLYNQSEDIDVIQ